MTLKDFFKRRLVRLHPMVIVGTLIGAVLFYFGDRSAFPLIMKTPLWEVNLLNGPTWSLMREYMANILYALFIRHFSKLALGIFVVLSACLTLDIALAAYTFIGDWSVTPD